MTSPTLSATGVASEAEQSSRDTLAAVRWRAARPMILAAALISAAYLSLAAVVISVDPHDVYSWGAQPRIEEGETPRDLVVDWIDVAAKDRTINTYLVGSSVTAMYTPEYLEGILGDGARVANLSYGGPRPHDRDLVLDKLGENPNLQRIILTFDWMYMQSPDETNNAFPAFLYDSDITNDLRMVNPQTILTTFDILRGNTTYSNPDDAIYTRFVDDMYDGFQKPGEMAKIGQAVERYQPRIGASSGRDCDSYPAINDQLIPDLKALSAKGVKVDIMIPIWSYAFYYIRQNDISSTLLDELMVARRCLVNASSDIANVRVFAFDDDPEIAGDLANFREVGHVYDSDILRKFIDVLNTGNHLLTADNFADHERAVRSAVENYRPTNSRMDRETELTKL